MKDTHTLLLTMSERNPFAESTSLSNIMTGVNATGDVDVCHAKEIGQKIMDSMTGIPVAQYTFKRSDQVRHFSRSLQCALMDSRYTATCSNASLSHPMPVTTERCHPVSALFDDTLMPRAPQKAVLANAIWTRLPPDIAGPIGEVQHVLDDGALLHRITWPHGFPPYQDIYAPSTVTICRETLGPPS